MEERASREAAPRDVEGSCQVRTPGLHRL